jgi:hypothetical protein
MGLLIRETTCARRMVLSRRQRLILHPQGFDWLAVIHVDPVGLMLLPKLPTLRCLRDAERTSPNWIP